ncbi:hypothetical protein J3E07_001358 [Methanococcus voltae]|uniref:Uncharacterized protein n=1 Tax=Methanococcus voltae TaxID=2188 RepID=A0A8J7S5T3_METVO|nr:hypothetical protein [Methanococcus voltae]MBP2201918.1 hypothetical protein [Methanococcus voltae]
MALFKPASELNEQNMESMTSINNMESRESIKNQQNSKILQFLYNLNSENSPEATMNLFRDRLLPYLDYPNDIIQKNRKIELIKILDDLFGAHTSNGELDYLSILDSIHDLLCNNQIVEVEYTYMIQILSFCTYNVVLFDKNLDLQIICNIIKEL